MKSFKEIKKIQQTTFRILDGCHNCKYNELYSSTYDDPEIEDIEIGCDVLANITNKREDEIDVNIVGICDLYEKDNQNEI